MAKYKRVTLNGNVDSVTSNGDPVSLSYLNWQQEVLNDPHKYKVIAKGRRVGGTTMAAHYVIERMLEKSIRILWVDTTQRNLSTYFDRLFKPALRQLKNSIWSWNESQKILKILGSVMDMRSAERPENLEGYGYHLVILNEAGIILANRSLWEVSIRPMTLDFGAEVLAIGTPKGKRSRDGKKHLYFDFYNMGLKTTKGNEWKSWRIPTRSNTMLKVEDIEELEREVPSVIRSQELEGEFVDISAESLCKESWFKYCTYEGLPRPENILRRVLSLDTAFKTGSNNDYTAGTDWIQTYDGKLYLIDAWAERLTFPDLHERIKRLYDSKNYDMVLIEDKASGQSLIQSLQTTGLPISAYKPDNDKISRFVAVTPIIESGKMILLKGAWNADYISQLVMFPQTEYDDYVDSTSQALASLKYGGIMSSSVYSRKFKFDHGDRDFDTMGILGKYKDYDIRNFSYVN
jgi:predicted phage terminase large subunit-like protein